MYFTDIKYDHYLNTDKHDDKRPDLGGDYFIITNRVLPSFIVYDISTFLKIILNQIREIRIYAKTCET